MSIQIVKPIHSDPKTTKPRFMPWPLISRWLQTRARPITIEMAQSSLAPPLEETTADPASQKGAADARMVFIRSPSMFANLQHDSSSTRDLGSKQIPAKSSASPARFPHRRTCPPLTQPPAAQPNAPPAKPAANQTCQLQPRTSSPPQWSGPRACSNPVPSRSHPLATSSPGLQV
jgi:hypothetical protein